MYSLPLFPGGYVYNVFPFFENKTPLIDEKYGLDWCTTILFKLGKFENNNPGMIYFDDSLGSSKLLLLV